MTGATPLPAGELAAWPGPLAGGAQPLRWAVVDVAALRRNAAAVAALVGPGCEVMAMVKANAYGHGARLAARALLDGGVGRLGVSSAEEALQLRDAGFNVPLLVVGWTHPTTHAALVGAGVEVTVFDVDTMRSLVAAARRLERPVRAHLKVDTGMGRLGAAPEAVAGLLAELRSLRSHVELAGVFTHFADADGSDPNFTAEQHARFVAVVDHVRDGHPDALVHCSNSAAMLRFAAMNHDLVRPGLVLYGHEPAHCEGVIEVEAALSMLASITRVFTVRRGETVGYNRTWQAPADTRIAAVAAGYADGVQRAQSNCGHVLVHGVRCPIVGTVSMDQLTADVSAVEAVATGDVAVVLAGGRAHRGLLDAAAVARAARTSAYEVLCGVSARVPRYMVGGGTVH
ncbi:MAG TPA: alanine racemase [Candidatus Dormibacteraeota bacterium]